MEYQWNHVEGFLKRLGFLAEARKLMAMTENVETSKGKLVEAISETLEPHNLRKIIGNSRLIPIHNLSKPERNHKLILARLGIGYLGNISFKKIGLKYGVSVEIPRGHFKRFEEFVFPKKEIKDYVKWIDFLRLNDELSENYTKDSRTKDELRELSTNAEKMTRTYVNPIKSDIYHRYLEKICEDPKDIQLNWIQN